MTSLVEMKGRYRTPFFISVSGATFFTSSDRAVTTLRRESPSDPQPQAGLFTTAIRCNWRFWIIETPMPPQHFATIALRRKARISVSSPPARPAFRFGTEKARWFSVTPFLRSSSSLLADNSWKEYSAVPAVRESHFMNATSRQSRWSEPSVQRASPSLSGSFQLYLTRQRKELRI